MGLYLTGFDILKVRMVGSYYYLFMVLILVII